jgi:hypothetical protein
VALKTAIVCILLAVAALPAWACYSGLVNIPTADVVEPGQYGIELQFDDSFARGSEDTRIVNTELGLTPRFEAGVDFDVSREAESRVMLNAKYILWPAGEGRPALALGICNVGRRATNTPYLVATREFRSVRGHLGAARIDHRDCWIIGADRAVTDKLTLMADYTSGSDNSATIGGSYQFTDSFGIMAGVILPNCHDEDTEFTVHLVFNGPYRYAQEEN